MTIFTLSFGHVMAAPEGNLSNQCNSLNHYILVTDFLTVLPRIERGLFRASGMVCCSVCLWFSAVWHCQLQELHVKCQLQKCTKGSNELLQLLLISTGSDATSCLVSTCQLSDM